MVRVSSIILFVSFVVMASCGIAPQITGAKTEKKEKSPSATKQVESVAGEETKVTTDSGITATVEDGVLPEGASLAISESVAQPTAFSTNENIVSASDPLLISALDADGNDISELEKPLTLQLPLPNTAALVAVEESNDKLCALLEKKGGGNFLWRRDSLVIDEGSSLVTLKTKYLGVFQLVYCGDEVLEGFANVAESTDVIDTFGSLTIPADLNLFSQSHACVVLFAIDGNSVESATSHGDIAVHGLAFDSVELSDSAKTVIFKNESSVDLAAITGENFYYGAGVLLSSAHCSIDPANLKISSLFTKFSYSFALDQKDVAAKKLDIKIGSGKYELQSHKVELASDSAFHSDLETKICVGQEGAGVGGTEVELDFSRGYLNGAASVDIPLLKNVDETDVSFFIGKDLDCNADGQEFREALNIFGFADKKNRATDPLKLTTVKFSISSTIAEISNRVCVEVQEDSAEEGFHGRITVDLPIRDLVIPVPRHEYYALNIYLPKNGESCDQSGIKYIRKQQLHHGHSWDVALTPAEYDGASSYHHDPSSSR